jgi:hypothetical protein
MANWYTSTRNGNDTTGDGTIALPYATIFKAASLASTGDTINTEGDPLVDSGVTGTFNGTSTSISTSSSLTSVLSAGSIFTIDDPVWGTGKQWFKVRSITSTSITCNQAVGAVGTFNIKYIATPSYTSNSSAIVEDLSSLTLDGINFEGGWNEDFTVQDRITWSTYVTTSSIGATTFLRLNTTSGPCKQNNLSFNNFGVGGNIMFNAGQCSGGTYNNLYSAYGTIHVAAGSTINNLAIAASSPVASTSTGSDPIAINNLYFAGGLNGLGYLSYGVTYKVSNMYVKATSNTLTNMPTVGPLGATALDINMLYIDWQLATTANSSIVLGDDNVNSYILRGITHQGNYVGTGKKITALKIDAVTNAQIITTQNVDDWGIQSMDNSNAKYFNFNPIKDIEGDKQFFAAGNVVFADSSQSDTGSNSLRISRAITTTDSQTVPIKSFYNADGTAKTITIRAKASVPNITDFAILPNAAYTKNALNLYTVIQSSHEISDTWADYSFTLTTEVSGYMQDSFINVGIITSGSWASEYVWIDSVIIA